MNRGSQGLPRVLFGYFLHDAKSNNPFPFREVRGFPNLESAHLNNNFPLTKLKPSQREIRGSANLESVPQNNNFPLTKLKSSKKEIRGFPNLESAHPNQNFAQTQLNPFAALGGDSFRLTAVSCCCRNIFCRLRRLSFLLRRKFVPAGTAHSVCFFGSFCLPQKEYKPVSCIGNGSQNRSLLCLGGIVRMIRILFLGLRTRK